jgi:hypothetical protein
MLRGLGEDTVPQRSQTPGGSRDKSGNAENMTLFCKHSVDSLAVDPASL